jgi:hypothetical protein
VPLEFIDEPPPADGDFDERPAGRRHAPTWLTALAVVAAVAIAVLIATQHTPGGAPSASNTPAASSRSAAPKPTKPVSQRISAAAALVLAFAERTRPLDNFARFGGSPTSCAQVSVHRTPPQRTVVAAIDAIVAPAHSTTTMRVINQFQGLCELVVRAVERNYVLVAMITSPPAASRHRPSEFVQLGNLAIADDVLAYVQIISVTNWSVVVGTFGTDRASDRDLLALAQDPRMQWG